MKTIEPSLKRIAQIEIIDQVCCHRFVKESYESLKKEIQKPFAANVVVGTNNTQKVEMYAFGPDIGAHTDDQGFVYILPILGAGGFFLANESRLKDDNTLTDPTYSLTLDVGTIYRLNDRCLHWTRGNEPTVALFLGAFDSPCDEIVEKMFRDALKTLAAGLYYEAPRQWAHKSPLSHDECYVSLQSAPNEPVRVLINDLDHLSHFGAAICGIDGCHHYAATLDGLFPYEIEMNRCLYHAKQ